MENAVLGLCVGHFNTITKIRGHHKAIELKQYKRNYLSFTMGKPIYTHF